jgi:predicted small lipoprotein YifL
MSLIRFAAVLIIMSLAACGMKGPLELPPAQGTKPQGADLSTPKTPTAR